MTHSIDMAVLERWQHLQFMGKFVNLQRKKKPVEEKKWTTSLVNTPEKKRPHPLFPLQLQCLKIMDYKEITQIQVSINMAPLCNTHPVLRIWQQVAALVVVRGVPFMVLTIYREEHRAVIYTSLHIVDQVNMMYKPTYSNNILNLFMKPMPHQGNKNT